MAAKQKAQPTALIALNEVEILTPDEVAERLKIKTKTIYELTRSRCRHPIPVHRAGKALRFSWSEVLAWFLEKEPA